MLGLCRGLAGHIGLTLRHNRVEVLAAMKDSVPRWYVFLALSFMRGHCYDGKEDRRTGAGFCLGLGFVVRRDQTF